MLAVQRLSAFLSVVILLILLTSSPALDVVATPVESVEQKHSGPGQKLLYLWQKVRRLISKPLSLMRRGRHGGDDDRIQVQEDRRGSTYLVENSSASNNIASKVISVPVIDISKLFNGSKEERKIVAASIGRACEDIGFFVIVNHGVDKQVLESVWEATREFFDLPLEEKMTYVKPQNEYPFGYTKFKGEILSAGKAAESISQAKNSTTEALSEEEIRRQMELAADLKEMFSLGPKDPRAGFPDRLLPTKPELFAEAWDTYYETMANLARVILRAFALALELPSEEYFEQFIDHHASALRALNYPHLEGYVPVPGQLRASAHTDYGTITILRSDAPGLQVSKDKDPPSWIDVPFVADGFVVNLGDLMKRWTNDRWLSTLHRVVNPSACSSIEGDEAERSGNTCSSHESATNTRRQSMAFFHNLNRDAVVRSLGKDTPKYAPIVAGDFLMQKHLAATSGLEEKATLK